MKSVSVVLPLAAGLLSSAAFLCGYTVLRVPPVRREAKRHIACVGDSLSYGCGVPLFFLRRYPAVLGRLLGKDDQVAVFAVNDRTLQNTGNKPFRRERAFLQSKEYGPEIVVLLLGTNDAKDRNWIGPEAFRRQYRELIDEYRQLPSRPRILLCTPPCAFHAVIPLFDRFVGVRQARIPEIAAQTAAVAAQEHLELIDLYALTRDRRDLFGPDGLHPSGKGAAVIAAEICKAIGRNQNQ